MLDLQALQFKDLPNLSVSVTGSQDAMLISGSRHYFYVADFCSSEIRKIQHAQKGTGDDDRLSTYVECADPITGPIRTSFDGRFAAYSTASSILVFCTKTFQKIVEFTANAAVISFSFSVDSRQIYAISEDRHVYVYDLCKMRCVSRALSYGGDLYTSITVSEFNSVAALG